MQLIAPTKASGRPLSRSSLELLLRASSSSLALIMLLAVSFIQGSSPLTRKMRAQRRLSRSSLRERERRELAARLLNLSEPLNLSLNSSGICLPLRMQGTLSSKSVRQTLCRCLPRPTRKLLGLMSPWITSFRCRYSTRSTICRPTITTVLRVSLPPHLTRKVSRFSPSSSMARQVLPFSQKASLISGKPWRWGCFSFWQVCIQFCSNRLSCSAQLLRKKRTPSCRTHFCTTLYPLSFTTSTGLYLPFIINISHDFDSHLRYNTQGQIMDEQAKIYLLMGRFASGKTTLIRRILSQQTGEKYAIIQNEFAEGEMGIEQPLIMDESGTPFSSFLELPNGCICCSAKNDLIAAVEYIVSNTPVRRIVVQTNGLADPAASIKQFWFDEEMKINAQLYSVITMVSARKWSTNCKEEIFLKQCAFANHILVSFIDLEGEECYSAIRNELTQLNCQSSVDRSDQANLLKILHGESLFNQDILTHLQSQHHHHPHSHAIRPLFLKGICTAQTKSQLQQRLGELLWERGYKVLRIKGVFCLKANPFVLELQGVEDLFEIKDTKTATTSYSGESRVLVIGEELPQGEIQALLQLE